MKYIKANIAGLKQIIIFPKTITHEEMARIVREKVLSAGFVNSNWKCYGESVSLGVKAEEEDTDLLLRLRQ